MHCHYLGFVVDGVEYPTSKNTSSIVESRGRSMIQWAWRKGSGHTSYWMLWYWTIVCFIYLNEKCTTRINWYYKLTLKRQQGSFESFGWQKSFLVDAEKVFFIWFLGKCEVEMYFDMESTK